jgi:hypothetical protein
VQVCFDCPQRFTTEEAAETHCALKGHLVGDLWAVQEWAERVAASSVTGVPLQLDERRAA